MGTNRGGSFLVGGFIERNMNVVKLIPRGSYIPIFDDIRGYSSVHYSPVMDVADTVWEVLWFVRGLMVEVTGEWT